MEFYASSIQAAGRLEDAASELGRQVAGIEELLSTLDTGWQGEAVQIFKMLVSQYEEEFRTSQLQLYRLATAIRTAAMELEAQRQGEGLSDAVAETAAE